MTDKEKIRAEMIRLREKYQKRGEESDALRDGNGMFWGGVHCAFNEMINFIDSMQEEPVIKKPVEGEFPYDNPSDTLSGEVENIWNKLSVGGLFTATKDGFSEVVAHFAEWQKEQTTKDLPKWKRTPRKGKYKPTTVGFSNIGEERLYWEDYSITIKELEKLPKED